MAERDIIGGLLAVLVASCAAFFAWVVASINRLDRKIDSLDAKLSAKIDAKIDSLDGKLSGEIKSLDDKLSAKIDALNGRLSSRIDVLGTRIDPLALAVARSEGAVWGRAPAESAQGRG